MLYGFNPRKTIVNSLRQYKKKSRRITRILRIAILSNFLLKRFATKAAGQLCNRHQQRRALPVARINHREGPLLGSDKKHLADDLDATQLIGQHCPHSGNETHFPNLQSAVVEKTFFFLNGTRSPQTDMNRKLQVSREEERRTKKKITSQVEDDS